MLRALSRILSPQEWGLIVAIVLVIGGTIALDRDRAYLDYPAESVRDIARHTALLGIVALGSAIVIIAGGIDLSAGSMIAFSGTVCASIMLFLAPEAIENNQALGRGVIATAIAGTLVVGFLIGSLHAWLVASIGLPPFVATLATLVGLRSLARVLASRMTDAYTSVASAQIQVYDANFRWLATEVSVPVVLFLVLAAVVWLMLSRTVTGRHLYALGGNEEAARLSGIRTDRLKWLAYAIGAMCSSLAGILYVAYESTADPQTLGRGYELNAIAAAVVGGCSLQGGAGTVLGVMLGCLFLRVVVDGIAKIINTGAEVYEGLIVGILVVLAVALAQWRATIAARKRFFSGPLGIAAIVTLTLLAGTIASIASRFAVGVGVGAATLVLLSALLVVERRVARQR